MAEEEQKEKKYVPIDRGWAWMIVFAFFGSTFFMVGIAKSFGIVMQEIIVGFQVPVAKAATVMGASAIIYTLIAPFALAFGQQIGQRPVVMFGGVVGGILISLCFTMVGIEFIIVMFGIGGGLANACLFGNGLVMLGTYFRKHRSLANALALTGASVGQFALPPILDLLLKSYGLAGTFLFIGGFYFHVVVFSALYRPITFYTEPRGKKAREKKALESKENVSKKSLRSVEHKGLNGVSDKEGDQLIPDNERIEVKDKHLASLKAESKFGFLSSTGSLVMGSIESLASIVQAEKIKEQSKNLKSNEILLKCCGRSFVLPRLFYWHVLRKPAVILYTAISFCVFFGYFNFVVFMPLDAKSRNYTDTEKSWLVSTAGIGDLIGRIIVGIIGDRNYLQRYNILAFVTCVCGVNIIIFGFATNFWWCATHAGLYGLFGGAYVAINPVVLLDLVGLETMPQALGMVLLIQGLGAALGQPVEGGIKDATGSYQYLNYINGCMMIIGGCLMFSYPFQKKYIWKSEEEDLPTEIDLPIVTVNDDVHKMEEVNSKLPIVRVEDVDLPAVKVDEENVVS